VIILICPECGTNFQRYPSQVRGGTCSHKCGTAQQRKKMLKLGEDFIQRVSDATRTAMRDPEVRKRHLKGLSTVNCAASFKGGNCREPVEFVNILSSLIEPLGYIREFCIGVKGNIRNYKVDFGLPENKIAIECDGPSHRKFKQRELDRKKDQVLKALGWRVICVHHS
jgi:hypothetical protein